MRGALRVGCVRLLAYVLRAFRAFRARWLGHRALNLLTRRHSLPPPHTHREGIVYTQIEQAAIIKKAHPGMPVFVYSGFGFAAGFNNGTWPALESVIKDRVGSPYRDFFLQGASKTVATQTYCQQGHTSTSATGDHCLSFVWNMANATARDYFVDHVVAPLAQSESIDGVFYDGFNWGES